MPRISLHELLSLVRENQGEIKRHVDDCMKEREKNTRAIDRLDKSINALTPVVHKLNERQEAEDERWRKIRNGFFALLLAALTGIAGTGAATWITMHSIPHATAEAIRSGEGVK